MTVCPFICVTFCMLCEQVNENKIFLTKLNNTFYGKIILKRRLRCGVGRKFRAGNVFESYAN